MKIFDNFLDDEKSKQIEEGALNLPWYFSNATSDFSEIDNFQRNIPNVLETPYMVNLLGCHPHGTSANDIKQFVPIIYKLEEVTGRPFLKRIQRIKANLYLKRADYPDNCYQLPHVDMWNAENNTADSGEIFLYYVNDSDGDTFFFNEKFGTDRYTTMETSSPKRGKGVLFDNSMVHASSPPRKSEYRITLNFVFAK